ncbi:Long-chain-fatty-acid-CoA ligase [Pseudomonas reidholzensis]|uniref:Long-chain-fatty-acid-CoA ligase n=1 Tax=Pseudomonas reidholzensis TaxID=1785162 RepID=A0A383RW29_9PSED|nr:fatty acyl-CoA synthetase [Pseudomonas reidholzensis]SYX90993.1 Long-chain-fatty-acid-CoA ligase [Pseudomonas reidholzensis]
MSVDPYTALSGPARLHSVADIAARSAARYPHKLAIVDGEVSLSFAELDRLIGTLAAWMQQAGVHKGDRVLLFSHNCWQFPVAVLAAARIGAIAAPVNFMLGPQELLYILQLSQPALAIVEDGLRETFDAALANYPGELAHKLLINLHGLPCSHGWQAFEPLVQGQHRAPLPVAVGAEEPIRMMFTSGTESLPKGVLLSSHALLSQYVSCVVSGGMQVSDREVHAFPLYHCAQLDNFLMTDIYLGATSYLLRRPDPAAILATIERERISNLFCPPTAWIALLNCPAFATADLSSLKKVYYGASAMPRTVIETLRQKLPQIQFWQFYGQTEMASLATVLCPEDHEAYPGSVGVPALNVTTAVVDENDCPVDVGVVGEIVHRSPHLTLGYYADLDKTAAAFRNGWFHSGDLGYFGESGHLYVVDRIKDIVKTGGENVSTKEVEEVIYDFDGVREAAVFALPHPQWIEIVAAAVVAHDGHTLDTEALLRHCKAKLAGFKAPRFVAVVPVLPKNASGKVLKRELRAAFQEAAGQ